MSAMASTIPASGDSTMAAAVLVKPLNTSTPNPPLAMPAPAMPPISACELEEGKPSHQVNRFQAMAPISADSTTNGSITEASTMPVPMVLATDNPKNRKAMKLNVAAQATASFGDSTRVETIVAMELAAS